LHWFGLRADLFLSRSKFDKSLLVLLQLLLLPVYVEPIQFSRATPTSSNKPLHSMKNVYRGMPFLLHNNSIRIRKGQTQSSGQRILTKGRIANRQFFMGDNVIVTQTSRGHCSRLHAVIKDWMIPFATSTAAETPNTFQWAGQPPKLLLPIGRSRSQSSTWFLRPTWVRPPNDISIKRFCTAHPCTQHTHRHTDHATCKSCSKRSIYAVRAMWPKH